MKPFTFAWVTLLQTLLRVLPFPCRTGLRRIGTPDRHSPVLLTCNFQLTVERVWRALKGIDAYLLVANSRGVNVWCAATGGLLTNHDVLSVLKTSGIEDLVDHRNVILPQLAATGIEGGIVHRKSGWKVIWGPVDVAFLPAFLSAGLKTTVEMRTVAFPWPQRAEMAVAWAFPISLFALLVWPVWPQGVLPLAGLVWGLSFFIFLTFPCYEKFLRRGRKPVGFVFFDFGERGFLLLPWIAFLLTLVGWTLLGDGFSWPLILRWSLSSLVVVLLLSLDLMGSTPLYKSGLHEDRLLGIELQSDRCKGAGFCEQVCPTHVFKVDHRQRMASLPGRRLCVQCGACIVQCPFDALYFQSPGGNIVRPEVVRRFKLNLLGKRMVKRSSSSAASNLTPPGSH
ncbi:MAG: HgcAB-like fusion protein [Acidobacteriota bacterium]